MNLNDLMEMSNSAAQQAMGLPASWPKDFKDFFFGLVNDLTALTPEQEGLIRKKAKAAGVDEDEAIVFAKKIVAQNAEDEKDDDDNLPPELKKYQAVLENLEEENIAGAIMAFLKAEPAILLYLLIPVVCFFISFWLGLLGFFVALILIALKGYTIYKKIDQYL